MHNIQTYSAEFNNIKITNKYIKYYFKNVRDESNLLIKQFLWVKFSDLSSDLHNFKIGDRILFDAQKLLSIKYHNNFKLIKPHNIRMYKND